MFGNSLHLLALWTKNILQETEGTYSRFQSMDLFRSAVAMQHSLNYTCTHTHIQKCSKMKYCNLGVVAVQINLVSQQIGSLQCMEINDIATALNNVNAHLVSRLELLVSTLKILISQILLLVNKIIVHHVFR